MSASQIVLILVVVEDGLVREIVTLTDEVGMVLILVVVEDGLVPSIVAIEPNEQNQS